MNVNGLGAAGYPAAGKAKVRQAQDGTQSFDREFMGMASQTPPSFVGKVWTKEELMQSVDKQMQSNQSKKMSVSDMIKATCIEGTRARFRFAGEDKIYTFDEYIFNKAFGNPPKSLLYFCQDRIKESSYF